ncbi:lysophospholipid acyltransferase family protein [Taylorella equigenitalis]|uniref:Lipid A biosynthesis lauroyl acyltransferase n=3 Tax=Taylorella equigenitalis TaxID=29575 RepID=A0A654KG40_TAYEM|nr:lysophospholipid acyltransferase family protein [Taylorella equigenitalis]ADU91391.1 Lipid A biosynthesis lauroyl acyltransferase [Taylorella equigenitalis MCE9]AFN36479.1 lipid A biosynthesis lauroyl acyltransferase [Taylorella equigenitalis ATCC 35865]ASY31045.1 lipid A biosynthesis acyltransferase [Taylorella equigenitalis]ASY38347.1 lipid A biosynthesis acyltransferase [Taylorella equigenitalis]ASY39880.1 lipid A biosynthesis acyltransferase [Taylorella equigenitalis]
MTKQVENSFKYRLYEKIFKLIAGLSDSQRLKLGGFLTGIAKPLAKKRLHVARRNLEISNPNSTTDQINDLTDRHFRLVVQSYIDRAVLWYGSEVQINEMVTLKGDKHLKAYFKEENPVLVLGPHFVGLDAAATIMTSKFPKGATMYGKQSDLVMDAIVKKGRARFNDVQLLSRQDGVKKLIRLIKGGYPLYYLPDMDFGLKDSIFVPFFDVPTATLTSTVQLVRNFDMNVLFVYSSLDINSGKYEVEILPLNKNLFLEGTIEEATSRFNLMLEDWIRKDPAQYYWVHKRFKTRPEGHKSIY